MVDNGLPEAQTEVIIKGLVFTNSANELEIANKENLVLEETTITDNAAGGIDTVRSSVTWTLGNNLENLILTSRSRSNGVGNDLDNSLTGDREGALILPD